MNERLKLYRYALKRGYNCPSPLNYPKRFDLYVKTHMIEAEEDSKISFEIITICIIIGVLVIYLII